MSTPQTPVPTSAELDAAASRLDRLRSTLGAVLFGQETVLDAVVLGLVARGHLLLEGLPGLGKTQLARTLSQALGLSSRRIQFTPDLLPGDITGGPILQETGGRRDFVFRPGPLFANLILADEINRASPKTQSALLEAMQERRVSVAGETHPLPLPFFVIATQNPIELEGTYPLPEAQLDRFLFKIDLLPNPPEVLERIVTHRQLGFEPEVAPVMGAEDVTALANLASRVALPQVVTRYIAALVHGTQPGASAAASGVRFGASPRAALGLAAAARARALRARRPHAATDDVRAVAHLILGHRIILDYTARLEGRTTRAVVDGLLAEVDPAGAPLPQTLASAKV